MNKIELVIDPAVQPIFQSSVDDLGRLLHQKLPGTSVSYRGRSDGSKDAVAVITATAGLLVAARPIIVNLVTAYLASRGSIVEVDANAKGGLKMKVLPAKQTGKTSAKSKRVGKNKANGAT